MDFDKILRKHLVNLKPYSSARDEYSGSEGVFIDANENPFESVGGGHYNRYPDPLQRTLKEAIAPLKAVSVDQIFVGNGSDEPIDLLIRAFCEPKEDNVIITPPTYGMYQVCADIANVEVQKVSLLPETFELDANAVLDAVNEQTKMVFLCTPNNPTGNVLSSEEVMKVVKGFAGLVIIDEAYIDFTNKESYAGLILEYSNIVVLQTFSKAWGLAGLRVGLALADPGLIGILNQIKYPYNINQETQRLALVAVKEFAKKEAYVVELNKNKEKLNIALSQLSIVEKIYASESNFILAKIKNADDVFNYLIEHQVIARNRSKTHLCDNCIRFSVGTEEENERAVEVLKSYV